MTEAAALTLLAAAIIIGSVGAAIAYQVGPPATVASFDFAYVAFAALWGLVFFGAFPDTISLLGMAMIVISMAAAIFYVTVIQDEEELYV